MINLDGVDIDSSPEQRNMIEKDFMSNQRSPLKVNMARYQDNDESIRQLPVMVDNECQTEADEVITREMKDTQTEAVDTFESSMQAGSTMDSLMQAQSQTEVHGVEIETQTEGLVTFSDLEVQAGQPLDAFTTSGCQTITVQVEEAGFQTD